MSLQQSLFRGSARIELLYCVSQTLWRCHCNIVGSAGVPVLGFCIVFYTLWGHVTATKLAPRECPYWTFVLFLDALLRCHCNQVGSALFQNSYLCCVLHAMRRYHCRKVGCAAFRNWAVVLCCARSEAIDTMKLSCCQTSTRRRRNHKNMYHVWHVVKSYGFSNNSEAMFEAIGQET